MKKSYLLRNLLFFLLIHVVIIFYSFGYFVFAETGISNEGKEFFVVQDSIGDIGIDVSNSNFKVKSSLGFGGYVRKKEHKKANILNSGQISGTSSVLNNISEENKISSGDLSNKISEDKNTSSGSILSGNTISNEIKQETGVILQKVGKTTILSGNTVNNKIKQETGVILQKVGKTTISGSVNSNSNDINISTGKDILNTGVTINTNNILSGGNILGGEGNIETGNLSISISENNINSGSQISATGSGILSLTGVKVLTGIITNISGVSDSEENNSGILLSDDGESYKYLLNNGVLFLNNDEEKIVDFMIVYKKMFGMLDFDPNISKVSSIMRYLNLKNNSDYLGNLSSVKSISDQNDILKMLKKSHSYK